ncbi:MAG TPA: class I SAM-dependent methyltransferase [Ktedonobacteraceae bacterium]|nr:class I SAM-dependent methyltransferase [Ktedonobacteraceae bacterium]
MQNAIERWQALIDTRAQQMDTAYAQLGRNSADFWDRRARGFHRATKDTVDSDPLFQRLRQVVTPQMTVLDVGAGTGRFALALAPLARQIIAVEPNVTMLNFLRQDATEKQLANISYIPTTWQDAPDDLSADIVICSHVLYPIRDLAAFLTKMRKATRQSCYIYMRAVHFDWITNPLWRHFHGSERALPPTYIHALDVMYDIEIYADVEIVKMPQTMRYPTIEVALDELQEQLILPADAGTRAELRKQLDGWLVERDGVLTPPVAELVCAIIRMGP